MILHLLKYRQGHSLSIAICAAILLYALGMSIVAFGYYDIGQTMSVENDFYSSYAPAAQKILKGDFSSVRYYEYRGIGYPLLLAMLTPFTQDYFLSGKIISLISSLICLLLVYRIFSAISFPLLGLLTTLGLMFTKSFILFSYTVGSDMVFLALSLLSLYFLSTPLLTRKYLVLSGLLAGYAFLTRYNQLFFMPPILGYLLLWKPAPNLRLRVKNTLFFLAAYLIVIVPWFILLYKLTADPFYNLNYQNLAYDFIYLGDVEKDYFWQYLSNNYGSAWEVIRFNPLAFLSKFAGNLITHLPNQLKVFFPVYLIGFMVLGLVTFSACLFKNPFLISSACLPDKATLGFFLITGLSYYFFSGLIHYEERYLLYLLPFYLFFCFYPVHLFVSKLFKPKSGRTIFNKILVVLVYISLIFPMALNSYRFNVTWLRSLPRELIFFKEFLEYFPASNGKLMARTAHLPFLSGLTYQWIPVVRTRNELDNYLKKEGTELVYFSFLEAGARPTLSQILLDHSPRQGLIPLVKWEENNRLSILFMSPYGWRSSLPIFPLFFLDLKANDDVKNISFSLEDFQGIHEIKALLKVESPGNYEIGLAAERFSLRINGKMFLRSEPRRVNNFYLGKIFLNKGWHSFDLNFEMLSDDFFLTGPFWYTPEGKKEAIPVEALKIVKIQRSSD